jgi:pimeloyl-ACP methyl ester carboxylesterase
MRFLLVHGGFHGAWCWTRTIPELERLGHEAVAIDLPGHGERRDERSTLADRRDAILAAMRPGDVLVGHSGGGYDISLAADQAPDMVGHLVYLAAGLPREGRTVLEVIGGTAAPDERGEQARVTRLTSSALSDMVRPNAQGRLECVDPQAVRAYFYHDCDDETAAWAIARLTPAPVEFLVETVSIPTFWKADLPRSYIHCLQDRGSMREQGPAFAERLGVTPLTIDSSHSPFLSRPRELAELLVRATDTRPIRPPRPD